MPLLISFMVFIHFSRFNTRQYHTVILSCVLTYISTITPLFKIVKVFTAIYSFSLKIFGKNFLLGYLLSEMSYKAVFEDINP